MIYVSQKITKICTTTELNKKKQIQYGILFDLIQLFCAYLADKYIHRLPIMAMAVTTHTLSKKGLCNVEFLLLGIYNEWLVGNSCR